MLPDVIYRLGEDDNKILDISRALSSPERIAILKILNSQSMSVKELSNVLGSPMSTTLLNVNILANCNLIKIEETITKKGRSKLCCRICDSVSFDLFESISNEVAMAKYELPIGNYVDYDVSSVGCGIATKEHTLGVDNDPTVFFDNERFKAGYIWFKQGFLTYRLPNKSIPSKLNKMSISMEICSEAPFYRNDWKSEITLFICDKEIGTWISPGDFGGRRGKQNPAWWSDALTQFGILTIWEIREDGSYVNDVKISDVSINDLDLKKEDYISLKIGVKKDAKYVGGLSLFGKSFGDYNQDILVNFYWK